MICHHGDKRHLGKKKTFTGCNVTLDVKLKPVTSNTIKKDRDIQLYPCFIMIKGEHNHNIESAAALRELRVLPEIKEQFFKYFGFGMTTAQASRFHQDKLSLSLSDLANHAINPSKRGVAYLREVWLAQHHGSLGEEDMVSAIRRYAEENPTTRIELEFNEDRFTIVLVTDFMLRVHSEFREAGEVVFVDTTSHVDQLNTAVTPLLCAGPAGAAPLGVIFTSSQDEMSYTSGFRLLKKMLEENAFFGRGHPECFITDNSEAERKAIKNIWPDSAQYLCIFHVLQQVWRWLWNSSHGIQKEDRQQLMKVAKQLVYAQSQAEFQDHWMKFLQSPKAQQYDPYSRYLTNLVERQEEWSLMHRAGKLLHGHQTNNYAKSTMCIIKDIIVNRCKAFNTSQLLIFMNEVYDMYMKQRLLDVALGRKRVKSMTKASSTLRDIVQGDELKYFVKSESRDNVTYTVDMQIGICDCTSGQTGDVCKHQIACSEKYLLELPQVFKSTPENRQWLAGIAIGKEVLQYLVA